MSEQDWFKEDDYINPREGFAVSALVLFGMVVMLVFTVWAARKWDF